MQMRGRKSLALTWGIGGSVDTFERFAGHLEEGVERSSVGCGCGRSGGLDAGAFDRSWVGVRLCGSRMVLERSAGGTGGEQGLLPVVGHQRTGGCASAGGYVVGLHVRVALDAGTGIRRCGRGSIRRRRRQVVVQSDVQVDSGAERCGSVVRMKSAGCGRRGRRMAESGRRGERVTMDRIEESGGCSRRSRRRSHRQVRRDVEVRMVRIPRPDHNLVLGFVVLFVIASAAAVVHPPDFGFRLCGWRGSDRPVVEDIQNGEGSNTRRFVVVRRVFRHGVDRMFLVFSCNLTSRRWRHNRLNVVIIRTGHRRVNWQLILRWRTTDADLVVTIVATRVIDRLHFSPVQHNKQNRKRLKNSFTHKKNTDKLLKSYWSPRKSSR